MAKNTVQKVTRTTDAMKEEINMKNNTAKKTPVALEELLNPAAPERDFTAMRAAIKSRATAKMKKGNFPEEAIMEAIDQAPLAGRTWFQLSDKEPTEGVFLRNPEVVAAYGPNPMEGNFPYLLQVHSLPKQRLPKVTLKKEYTDEQMRQKLTRYLEGPFKGHDGIINAISREVSLRAKPFGIVFFHIYTDVAKALAVPAPREGDATPTATNYGGPGHSEAGFVPEDGVYLHLVYDEQQKTRHHFRIVLPEGIRPEAGTMLKVKPFCYGVQQKDE